MCVHESAREQVRARHKFDWLYTVLSVDRLFGCAPVCVTLCGAPACVRLVVCVRELINGSLVYVREGMCALLSFRVRICAPLFRQRKRTRGKKECAVALSHFFSYRRLCLGAVAHASASGL